MRSIIARQRGASLLILVVLLSIVAFSLVVGYSGVMARQQFNFRDKDQRSYLRDAVLKVEQTWMLRAHEYDQSAAVNAVSAAQVLKDSGVFPKYGMKAVLSAVKKDTATGLNYRVFLVYLPTSSEETAPFDESSFVANAVVPACTDVECSSRVLETFSSLDIERELSAQTTSRLNRVALKAQAFFRARMFQDPERNVSVNYFLNPGYANCSGAPLGCLGTGYAPLYALVGMGTIDPSTAAKALGLGSEELMSAWGFPLEVSNTTDAANLVPPFSISFRATTPAGTYIKVLAVQQL